MSSYKNFDNIGRKGVILLNVYDLIQRVANAYSSTNPVRPPQDEMQIHQEVEENLNSNALRTIFEQERLSDRVSATGVSDNYFSQQELSQRMFEEQRLLNEIQQQQLINQQSIDFTNQCLQQNMEDSLRMQNQINNDLMNQAMPPNNMF